MVECGMLGVSVLAKGKMRGNVFPYISIMPDRPSYIADLEYEKNALHEALEIKYFTEGTSTLIVGNDTITAKKGDIIVVNPYEFHATIDDGQPKGRYHMLIVPLEYFSGELSDDLNLKEVLLEQRMSFMPHFKATPDMRRCVLRIIEEHAQKHSFHHMIIRSLMLELIGLLLRENVKRQAEVNAVLSKKDAYRSIEPVLRYIRDNYSQIISLEDMAKLCNLSKHYFCHLFKQTLGKTAMEYLREYRMKVAYTMLERTDKSVSQIAGECGFLDDNYFSRCFRGYYGITPSKHREHMRQNRTEVQAKE